MSPATTEHPSATELVAFALGRLDTADLDRVRTHLSACPTCRSIADRTLDAGIVDHRGPSATAAREITPASQRPEDATLPPAPSDLPPALRDHPRYRVVRLLGRGGMGVVYQAEHKVMERPVAVKVIRRNLVDRPESIERFHREVRAAAKLDHANIVKAYDAEQVGDLQLLAMEFVEGKSLAEVLAKKGPLPVANACHYVRQAAQGLQHAFERGMVHRDLKPLNLMLTPKGIVKILDFGLAKLASESARPGPGLTQDNTVMGTPEYMAPEQATNCKAADIRADIYALGCTLYCLLAGRPPFTGESLAILVAHSTDAPRPVELLRPEVPPELAALVARCLSKNPSDRPQTPKELADALGPFAKPAKSAAGRPADYAPALVKSTAPAPVRRQGRGWKLSAAIAAAVLLVGGISVGIILTSKKETTNTVKSDRLADGPQTPTPDKSLSLVGPAEKAVLDKLDEVDSNLKKLRFGAHPVRGKVQSDALLELKGAIKALQAGTPLTDPEVVKHLEHVHIAVNDLKAVANENVNGRFLVDADKALLALLGPLKPADSSTSTGRRPPQIPPPTAKAINVDLGGGVKLELVRIPAGSFTMGSPNNEGGHKNDEDQHPVHISKAFYLGKYPVTQAQYQAVVGENPSFFCPTGGGKDKVADQDTGQFPVEHVSWVDAVAFCAKLRTHDQFKRKFGLPTEAEWEYACRGGTTSTFYVGNSLTSLQANFDGNFPYGARAKGPYLGRTSPVGAYAEKAPHPWGLCDVHGNVWQWCRDWYGEKYYSESPHEDPPGPAEGRSRVSRGGSWSNRGRFCRAADRSGVISALRDQFHGFRVAYHPD
jgi:serine/threonine protein kinase/formylglycine-generating enzyme required for sulfatase activity